MPEDIPAVEDIKFARKRLEELAIENPEQKPSLREQLEEKFSEEESLRYTLPENIKLLEQLSEIIK